MRASYRGQPLIALLLVVGGWTAMRVMVWESSGQSLPLPVTPVAIAAEPAKPPAHGEVGSGLERWLVARPAGTYAALAPAALLPAALGPAALPSVGPGKPLPYRAGAPLAFAPRPRTSLSAQVSATNQFLWLASLSGLPLPGATLGSSLASSSPQPRSQLQPAPAPALTPRDARWSADAWLLLRRGGTVSPAGGFAPATYGASQAGAVVRYRLATDSALRPAAYLRTSAALNGSQEREAALGLSARPFAGLPLVAAIEARLNQQPGGTRLRPAGFVYTELAPFALPLGVRAEAYAQAGYVGGNFASAFADGQVRADRRVGHVGRGELRAGGGVWGGAQKGASRLDVGPSATLGMPIGDKAGARLGVDWRFRVAGNAAPASGPAVTLSAGF